jgi:glycosyltransferase involved in cell wall biosynthesis
MLADEVRAAIVVATYKQPGLLIEALDTALGQQTDFGYVIVVVNDGCPMPEPHTVCLEFALRFPEKIRYLRQGNKGLSGARNAGIEFCLNTFANLEAVYFLDSDDRLYPNLLQRLFDALSASEADVGWVYTDMEMFGIAKAHDLSGRYTPSEHRIRNICPATSLVRRRMLDVGVRFDETMRFGAEDWDFWLQGIALGFRGSHVPWAGYRYRVRVESMVRGTTRNRDKVREHLFNKHAALFSAKALAHSEAIDLPRYALVDAGSDAVSYCIHPAAQRGALTLADFMDRLCRVGHRPDPGLVPPFVTMIAPGVR